MPDVIASYGMRLEFFKKKSSVIFKQAKLSITMIFSTIQNIFRFFFNVFHIRQLNQQIILVIIWA